MDRPVPDGFNGMFFNDIPPKISATPFHGYTFSHWAVEGAVSNTNHLIVTGSNWKYSDTGTDLGISWRNTSYNDIGWPTGPSQLGYGDSDEATTVSYGTDSQNKYITTYFRYKFSVENASDFTSLDCSVLVDDGAVIYLNGSEIGRINMPAGEVTYQTPAIGNIADENAYTAININPGLLTEGSNTISAEVHQSGGTSSDLSFDLILSGSAEGGSGNLTYNTPEIEITLTSNTVFTAFFEKDSTASELPVVINEINYRSATDFDCDDWIELYNYSDGIVNISGCQFKDSGGDVVFELPDNLYLEPDAYLVLCKDTSKFDAFYPEIANRRGNFSFGLSGDGELITLLDNAGGIIDEVLYSNSSPWPLNTNATGYTIELIDPEFDNNNGSNWAASGDLHGSPGRKNNIIVDVHNNRSDFPSEYSLNQNYPNPFNPVTTISYQLPQAGEVELNIYNIMGQKVAELVSAYQEAGYYNIKWNAQNIASGIYFYRFRSADFIQVKRMLLLK
jgi:hypothetical protein